MNLILFEPSEINRPLTRQDRRAVHILDVLRRRVGESFDVGLINEARGKATLIAVTDAELQLSFTWETGLPRRAPIMLIVGLPRPQTARDILRDATTLGVSTLHFVLTEKSEPGYAQSTLWSSGEWRRQLVAGAEQAFDPCIPEVSHTHRLAEILPLIPGAGRRLALDNYESAVPLSAIAIEPGHVALAIGSERGWSQTERDQLREAEFSLVHLGARVLRTETACVAALSIVRASLGLM